MRQTRRWSVNTFSAGQAALLATIALIVLLGSVAMATDIGLLWHRKRQMQTAADAAVLAGANLLVNGGDWQTAATNVATINGFTSGSNGVSQVTVDHPWDGIYAGDASYIEVYIEQAVPTYFLGVFGYTTVNVAARAVGSKNTSSQNCIVVLDKTASGALTVSGTGTALTLKCNLIVNSTSSTGAMTQGGATVNAKAIGVAGNYSGGGFTPTPKTKTAPESDPLTSIQAPTVGACASTGCTISGSSGHMNVSSCTGATVNAAKTVVTLTPGVYCSSGAGHAITDTSSGTVQFSSGTYILDGGGMQVNGGATITGTGVTFYNTKDATHAYGGIKVAGGATCTLSAPTSGSLNTILFFQDRSVTANAPTTTSTISGGSNSSFTGVMYFSTTELDFSGGGGTNVPYTIFVADILHLAGGTGFTVNNDYSSSGGSPIKEGVLYE